MWRSLLAELSPGIASEVHAPFRKGEAVHAVSRLDRLDIFLVAFLSKGGFRSHPRRHSYRIHLEAKSAYTTRPATALRRGGPLIARSRDRYPSAMECLEKDLKECVTYLVFPAEHRKRIRTTNLLGRTFGESRRRTKVIPRLPGDRSYLALIFASLITGVREVAGDPDDRADPPGLGGVTTSAGEPLEGPRAWPNMEPYALPDCYTEDGT